MKLLKNTTMVFCIILGSTLLSFEVQATSLSFVPSMGTINLEETIDMDIVVSDLSGVYVGGFDLDITFDDTLLSFNSYSLTDNLGDLGAGDAWDISWGDDGFGTVNVAELSFLWDLSFQPDSFTLATLSFTGSALGTSDVTFSRAVLSDDMGFEIAAELNSGSVAVNTAPVPEPTTILLFGTGIAGLAAVRRKRK